MSKTSELLKLANHHWPIPWNKEAGQNTYRRIERSMLLHMPALISAARAGNWLPDYSAAAFMQLWGNLTDHGHAFNAPSINWGFNLTEPQCTKALAHFLCADGNAELSRVRCAAFVRALYRAAGISTGNCLKLEKVEPGSLKVEAERAVGKKRIDLALEWKEEATNGESDQRLILIEGKFNHHVTKSQLSIYRQFANRHVKSPARALFLVIDRMTSHTARMLNYNREWIPLTWRALIRRLEIEMASLEVPPDHDFARLRKTIWEMCTNQSI